jgi:hypothetical protein
MLLPAAFRNKSQQSRRIWDLKSVAHHIYEPEHELDRKQDSREEQHDPSFKRWAGFGNSALSWTVPVVCFGPKSGTPLLMARAGSRVMT